MESLLTDERTLSELDHVRLSALVRRTPAAAAALEPVLDSAPTVVPADVPPDLVTMHSRIELAEVEGESPGTLTLCYPTEADAAHGAVSVLSPVGTALLGRRVGTVARWTTPDGRDHAARIVAIPYQPEASGDLTA